MSSKCLLQFFWFSLKAFLSWKNKPWPQPKMRSPPIYIILTSSACDFSVLTSEKYWSDLLRYISTNSSIHSWHTPRHVAKTWDILVTRDRATSDNCPQRQTHSFVTRSPLSAGLGGVMGDSRWLPSAWWPWGDTQNIPSTLCPMSFYLDDENSHETSSPDKYSWKSWILDSFNYRQ